jgi:HlyD family secretion protein
MLTTGSRSALASLEAAQKTAADTYTTWQHSIIWYGEYHGRTETAKAAYETAEEDLRVAQLEYDLTVANQQASLASAQSALDDAQANYDYATHYVADDADVALAEANLAVAEADLAQAEATLGELRGLPLPAGTTSTLNSARNAVTQAELALAKAQQALEDVTLTSPIAGTVTAVNAVAGMAVGTTTLVTVADLDNARVEFYVDESDVAFVHEGYPISVVFDAAPETTFTGEVLRVDPALVSVNNTAVVQAWATLDPANDAVRLIAGMNGTVEITAGEARGALIVPIEALRELTPNSFAVFVVQPDGSLKLTPVTVGLMDVANAEITAGLNQGDVVSTGVVETAS